MMRCIFLVAIAVSALGCSAAAERSAEQEESSVSSNSPVSAATSERYQQCATAIENNPQFQGMPRSSRDMMVQGNCAGYLEQSSSSTVVSGNERYNECVASIENNPQFAGMPNSSRQMMVQGNCAGYLER